ncbi:hypothetical protein DH2020_023473 [Rehmannia glutinosa]|uniref:Uncharacterized protein n=1 Tax=Rehmannia glutinosa TaxID=99300 RepID=A0ABR0WAB2_REHGL
MPEDHCPSFPDQARMRKSPEKLYEALCGMGQRSSQRRFKESIAEKPPASLEELLDRAKKHIRVEEATKPEVVQKTNMREEEKSSPKSNNKNESSRREIKRKYTMLNAPLVEVMYAPKDKES